MARATVVAAIRMRESSRAFRVHHIREWKVEKNGHDPG
jgi:hypothetical protein